MTMQMVQVLGHLGADPEVKSLNGGGEVCNLSLAVTERWGQGDNRQEHTEWFRCVCFDAKRIDVLDKYVRKGDKLFIQGRNRTRKWQDQSGNDRWSTEVIIDRVTLIERADGGGGGGGGGDRGGGDRGGGRDGGDRGGNRGGSDRGGDRGRDGGDRRGGDRDARGERDRGGDDRRGGGGDRGDRDRGRGDGDRGDRGGSRDNYTRGEQRREPANAGGPQWDAPRGGDRDLDDEIPF